MRINCGILKLKDRSSINLIIREVYTFQNLMVASPIKMKVFRDHNPMRHSKFYRSQKTSLSVGNWLISNWSLRIHSSRQIYKV